MCTGQTLPRLPWWSRRPPNPPPRRWRPRRPKKVMALQNDMCCVSLSRPINMVAIEVLEPHQHAVSKIVRLSLVDKAAPKGGCCLQHRIDYLCSFPDFMIFSWKRVSRFSLNTSLCSLNTSFRSFWPPLLAVWCSNCWLLI